MILLSHNGEHRSAECFKQWQITDVFNEIRYKAALALGLEMPILDENKEIYSVNLTEINNETEWAEKPDMVDDDRQQGWL